MPAAQALQLVGQAASTLARLHALELTIAPQGICHGDIKTAEPARVRKTADVLLLDFEHARAIGTATDERAFTGGTTAWSPPEAHRGARPGPAFDVFGLGATLAFLLDGETSRRVPRHPDVDALVLACCDPVPSRRPTAAELASRCQQLAATIRTEAAERHLDDWSRGAFAEAPTDADDPRSALWPRRRRLLQRLPNLLKKPSTIPDDPAGLQSELELVARVLWRFPRSETALERRRELLAAVAQQLASAAETVHQLHKTEQFVPAMRWLRTTEALISAASAIPGGLARIVLGPRRAPHRDRCTARRSRS